MTITMTKAITNRLEQLIDYLEPFLPLATCHMVDFFTNNLYQTHLSDEIQSEIDKFGQEAIKTSILYSNLSGNKCPKLYKFLHDCQMNTISRFNDVCVDLEHFQAQLLEKGCNDLSGLQLKVFASSKKSHEVEILSEITSAVNEIAEIQHIIDVGDGKGYLSSALALHKGFKVLGVDASDLNTKGAAKRARKLTKLWKSVSPNVCNQNSLYKQTTKFVSENTDLTEILQEHFPGDLHTQLGLVGLHTCGNLSPTCLRIFNNNVNMKTVCNVGCCYHMLDTTGFPMSNFLKNKHYQLARNALMLSCQSLDRILDKKELPSKMLFYRSLLQILILRYCPESVEKHVGRSHHKSASFPNYVEKALKKLGTNILIPENELNEIENNYGHLEGYIHIFYLLRAHLAPIIEGIILLDRLLFLHEHNYSQSYLIQLFNPIISPRCYGIIAFKNV